MLGLKASDLGCPLGNTLAGVEDLNRICTRVITDGAPHRVETRDGDRYFLLRIAAYTRNRSSNSGRSAHIHEYHGTKSVAPREHCGGFNGHVRYGSVVYESAGSEVRQRIVQIWGLVWDTCNHNAGSSTTSVYLSYNDCGVFTCAHNPQVGSAHAGTTSGVNQTYRTLLNAGHIAVTVCSNYGGRWQCGSPAPV